MKQDLNLQGTQYSWLSSVFYFGWMVCEFFVVLFSIYQLGLIFLPGAIPTNLIMQRSPPSTYLGINIAFWGIFLMFQAYACLSLFRA